MYFLPQWAGKPNFLGKDMTNSCRTCTVMTHPLSRPICCRVHSCPLTIKVHCTVLSFPFIQAFKPSCVVPLRCLSLEALKGLAFSSTPLSGAAMQCQQLPHQSAGCTLQTQRVKFSRNARRVQCTVATTDPLLLRVARGEGIAAACVVVAVVSLQTVHDSNDSLELRRG